jgi:hypothetical protein
MTTTAEQLEKRVESIENFKEIVGKFIKKLGDPTKYEFRGDVIDLKEYGRGTCTCGHPVRYMLMIWGPNGEVAPIGVECVKHFQSYNEALFGRLEKATEIIYEQIAAEEKARAEALRQAKKTDLQPAYELAKTKFLAVCKMHQDNINFYIPYQMYALRAELLKKRDYKTTNGFIKFYERSILDIEKTLGMYERGELTK